MITLPLRCQGVDVILLCIDHRGLTWHSPNAPAVQSNKAACSLYHHISLPLYVCSYCYSHQYFSLFMACWIPAHHSRLSSDAGPSMSFKGDSSVTHRDRQPAIHTGKPCCPLTSHSTCKYLYIFCLALFLFCCIFFKGFNIWQSWI